MAGKPKKPALKWAGKDIIMDDLLILDDKFYFDFCEENLFINLETYNKDFYSEITKEKAKEIIEFLTKFVEGE